MAFQEKGGITSKSPFRRDYSTEVSRVPYCLPYIRAVISTYSGLMIHKKQ